MNQVSIEKKVGITPEVAVYIMSANSPNAKTAMGLLALAVRYPDPHTMALLESAVKDCIKDIERMTKAIQNRLNLKENYE